MGRRREDQDVDVLVENWIGINRKEDPAAWEAWTRWRREQLGVASAPENLTVPTPFPPSTVAAAKEYIAIVQQIRAAIGWKSTKARLRTDVSAWMGG